MCCKIKLCLQQLQNTLSYPVYWNIYLNLFRVINSISTNLKGFKTYTVSALDTIKVEINN